MNAALLIYFLIYFGLAFVLPTWRVGRSVGRNALVLVYDDSAHGVAAKGFRLLILGLLGALLAGLWLPAVHFGPIQWLDLDAVQMVGAVLLLASLVWVIVAQVQMGPAWRIGIDTAEPTQLVRGGLFAWSRNPIFLSMRVSLAGLLLAWPNAATFAAFLVGEVLMQLQVRLEEQHLEATIGDAYLDYKARVRRWL